MMHCYNVKLSLWACEHQVYTGHRAIKNTYQIKASCFTCSAVRCVYSSIPPTAIQADTVFPNEKKK